MKWGVRSARSYAWARVCEVRQETAALTQRLHDNALAAERRIADLEARCALLDSKLALEQMRRLRGEEEH